MISNSDTKFMSDVYPRQKVKIFLTKNTLTVYVYFCCTLIAFSLDLFWEKNLYRFPNDIRYLNEIIKFEVEENYKIKQFLLI